MNLRELIFKEFGYHEDDNLPLTPMLKVTRLDLYKLMGIAGFKVGAEIGVWNGINAKEMLNCIKGLELFCIDSWSEFKQENEFSLTKK